MVIFVWKYSQGKKEPFSMPPSEFSLKPLSSMNLLRVWILLISDLSRWAEIVTWFTAYPFTRVQAAYSLSLLQYDKIVKLHEKKKNSAIKHNGCIAILYLELKKNRIYHIESFKNKMSSFNLKNVRDIPSTVWKNGCIPQKPAFSSLFINK